MNFKYLIILIFVTSCGVKGNPTAPEGSSNPSVLDNYRDIQLETPLKENKKK